MDDRFHLYVADPHNDRVRHFSAFGRHLGDLGLPAEDHVGSRRDRRGFLSHPNAVAVYGDQLYVACGDRPLRRGVQRLHRDGSVLEPLSSDGDPERRFAAPRGIWADRSGVLVADTLHGAIQRFRLRGTYVATVRLALGEQRSRPIAVARQQDGTILVVDDGDLRGLSARSPDGSMLSAGDLTKCCEDAVALTVDERDRVYVLDRHGERVQRFHADRTFDEQIVDLQEHLNAPGSTDPC